jgi:hypothetical protein
MAAAPEVGPAVTRDAARTAPRVRAFAPLLLLLVGAPGAHAASHTFIVSGLGGEPQYDQRFREQAAAVAEAAKSTAETEVTVLSGEQADRESVRKQLRALAAKAAAEDRVTVVLIGHGSFDGEEYRLNLPGPDITATELGNLFDQLRARDQLIVNATSASGAVAERWKRNGRVVITATKSGGERTATRFGEFWKQAVASPEADVNKDEVVSAAEAYEFATRKVADAFKSDASLATEHARIEGTGAERFVVARFGAAAVLSADPEVNALYAQRTNLENELTAVKERKQSMPEDVYYDELETVLVKLATLQRQIDAKLPAGRGGRGE